MSEPILIVGGGLGGLTAALALAQLGWPVRLLEAAPEFGAIGYGIQFGPNVFQVLDRIGVTEAVLEKADAPPAVLMIDALTGKEVTRVSTGSSFRARFKYPYIIVHRIDLHNVLLEACRRDALITLEPDAMVTQFQDHGERVTVTTEDGRSFEGAALIGADGIRSRTRAQLLADGDPAPNGFIAFRTIVPMGEVTAEVRRDIVALWGGPGFHIVHYPLRHGTLFNIVAVFRRSAHSERGDVAAYRAELEHAYRDAHPTMKALLAMLDLGRRQAVGDRDPIRHWHKERVVLLGDAAHPTLQSLAQGACMAIEDGLCLADCVAAANGD
jgi:salicylate hydroxylase